MLCIFQMDREEFMRISEIVKKLPKISYSKPAVGKGFDVEENVIVISCLPVIGFLQRVPFVLEGTVA